VRARTDLGRRLAATSFVLAVLTLGVAGTAQGSDPAAGVAGGAAYNFSQRLVVPPLTNSRQWVLTGTKLANGGCRYKYPNAVQVVPESG